MPQKYFLTTPIYYVNARPHIGHAYTTIVADVLARRHRLLGEDVFFLTGTDEHGQKIERSAAAAGIPPQQFADQVSKSFQDLWKRMGITNDAFIRTTDEAHKHGVQKLFKQLYDSGHIYLDSYTGAYCVSDEAFVDVSPGDPCPECGRATETVTEENFFFRLSAFQLPLIDLIESKQFQIDSKQNEVLSFLRGPVSSAGSPGELSRPDVNYSALNNPYVPGTLKDLSVSRSSFTWGVPVPREIEQAAHAKQAHVVYVWLDALANYITALGYGSSDTTLFTKFWPADVQLIGKEIVRFHAVYWPAFLLALNPKTRHEPDHPTPMLSPEEHLVWAKTWLPKVLSVHGWLLFEDAKMSKTKGNVVRTETILDAFGDQVYGRAFPDSSKEQRDLFASDVLRYFLLREIPFGQDGNFSFQALVQRYNADLANGYGNVVSRVLKLIEKKFGSGTAFFQHPRISIMRNWLFLRRPDSKQPVISNNPYEVFYAADGQHKIWNYTFSAGSYKNVLEGIFTAFGQVDEYLNLNKPWELGTEDESSKEKLAEVLYVSSEAIRLLTVAVYPFIPFAAASVWKQLGLGSIETAVEEKQFARPTWGDPRFGGEIGEINAIFPRIYAKDTPAFIKLMTDMEQGKDASLANITTQADAATPTATEFPVTSLASELVTNPPEHFPTTDPAAGSRTTSIPEPNPGTLVAGSHALTTERPAPESGAPGLAPEALVSGPADSSPQITIDDFAKVELRVAKILVAERIPKADKLLRLEVDLGYERRQILSGIAEWYTPGDLLGRRIVVITNLAPRKMRGLESHGMLLAASAPEGGKPSLATFPDTDDLPLGSRLK